MGIINIFEENLKIPNQIKIQLNYVSIEVLLTFYENIMSLIVSALLQGISQLFVLLKSRQMVTIWFSSCCCCSCLLLLRLMLLLLCSWHANMTTNEMMCPFLSPSSHQ